MTQKVAVPQKNWANVANPIIYKPTEDGLDTTHLWWFWGWFMALGFRHYHTSMSTMFLICMFLLQNMDFEFDMELDSRDLSIL